MIGGDLSSGRTPSAVYPVIVEHMRQIRQVPGCARSTIVVVPESNLGFEAANISGFIADELGPPGPGNYVIMVEDELRSGVKTDEDLKHAMSTSLDMSLRMRLLRFHRNFFSVGDQKGATEVDEMDVDDGAPTYRVNNYDHSVDMAIERERRADRMRDTLVDQLRRWTRTIKPRKDPNDPRPPGIFYSGKAGGQDDDGTIALCLPHTMRKRFHASDKYQQYWTHAT